MTQISEERRDENTCAVIGAAVEPKALGRLTGSSLLNCLTISRAAGFEIGLIVICVICEICGSGLIVICEICGLKGVRK